MTRIFFLATALSFAAQAQTAPSVEDAKRAIDQRLQKIWKSIGTKGTRTVVFQDVIAGRPTPGHYPFRVTMAIHDQEAGYPANRYYGRTCVGRLEQETYILSADEFGGWDAQGRMTPDMSATTCKNNPADGVSSIPLNALQGTRASTGGTAVAPRAAAMPAQAQQAAAGAVALGAYQCWGNGQARPLLNFTVLGGNQYRDSEGHNGTMTIDANSGRVTFRGGNLDGFLPAGFYAVYYAPQGRPTVSFRNSGGSEIQYCQHQ